MRITIHIKNAFFVNKEQKIWKVKLENGKDVTVKKPKKPECIVNTLTFKDVHPNNIEDIISNVRSKYGIKLKDKEEMVYVHPKSNTNIPKLCNTIQKFCDRMEKESLERANL